MPSTPITFGELINACLNNPGFFHELQDNPAQAITQAGYQATAARNRFSEDPRLQRHSQGFSRLRSHHPTDVLNRINR